MDYTQRNDYKWMPEVSAAGNGTDSKTINCNTVCNGWSELMIF